MITEPLGHFFLIAAVVHVALVLQKRFAIFRSLGSALVVTVTGILLSNSGILPGQSPVYDFMTRTGVNIAILLILLSVDLQSLRQAGPRMLAAFGLGSVGSIVGAILAALLFSRQIGPETWKLAGGFGASLTFLYVLELFGHEFRMVDQMFRSALDKFQRRSHRGGRGISVSKDVIHAPHAAAGIDRYSREHRFDLIVMATCARGLGRFFLGSTTEKVISQTELPVFVLPPKYCT